MSKKISIWTAVAVIVIMAIVIIVVGLKATKNGQTPVIPVNQDIVPSVNRPVVNAPTAPNIVIVDKDKIPATAVKLEISSNGFLPKEFTVKPGATVTLALTGDKETIYVLFFDAPVLASNRFIVGPNKTWLATFTAPTQVGDYTFYDNSYGQTEVKTIGTMIVK